MFQLGCQKGTVVFYAYATRDIQVGEEVTMDYGPNYFDDCPCFVCKPLPPQVNNLKRRVATRIEEEVEQEKRNKKKMKRQRQREKRKQGTLPQT